MSETIAHDELSDHVVSETFAQENELSEDVVSENFAQYALSENFVSENVMSHVSVASSTGVNSVDARTSSPHMTCPSGAPMLLPSPSLYPIVVVIFWQLMPKSFCQMHWPRGP